MYKWRENKCCVINRVNVNMDEEHDFWIGDRLPTIYEVAQTILHYSKRVDSNKRKAVVHKYAVSVRNTWVKSFTEKHVVSLNSVKNRIETIMKHYSRVQTSHAHRNTTLRARNRVWMNMDVPEPKTNKGSWKKGSKNSSLFDIGKNTETTTDKDGNVLEGLTGREKIFYDDQNGERLHLLSHEIDTEYEEEQLAIQQAMIDAKAHLQEEMEYINEDLESVSTSSVRQAPLEEDENIKVDKKTQVNIKNPTDPIRLVRNSTYEILDTISSVSTVAGVSVAKARKATREVCKRKYGDLYELEAPEEPVRKKPRTAEDYQAYANVLPSETTVNKFKHKKAITQEIIAAKALYSKKETTKVTLHFDTTTRSRIDGDWPSLILNFKDDDPLECRMISLRPLFFAYEDREQIIKLVVQTLERLSVAASKLNVTASDLWEKIDAIMTDSVSKNLKIEEGVAEALQSTHIPYHLLCKSHTCERLDCDNLTTLGQIETQIGLRDLLLRREPLLKSFLRSKKSVVEAAFAISSVSTCLDLPSS